MGRQDQPRRFGKAPSTTPSILTERLQCRGSCNEQQMHCGISIWKCIPVSPVVGAASSPRGPEGGFLRSGGEKARWPGALNAPRLLAIHAQLIRRHQNIPSPRNSKGGQQHITTRAAGYYRYRQ
jgi:hypothetical protein